MPKSRKSHVRVAIAIAIASLGLTTLAGCWNDNDQEKFLTEQRSDALGYRLEYFERDELLVVHRPDGENDGVDLAALRRVFLHRIPASDSSDGKPKYWWQFEGPDRVVSLPFFSGDPAAVITVLRAQLTGFNEAVAMKMTSTFENNLGSYCLVWASVDYLKETRTEVEAGCRP
jgi:hypothetical protein